jgi:hypothetical protein
MLKGFLQLAFRKFYGRYNDLIYNYILSLSPMLSDIFHTNSLTVLDTLTLTEDNSALMIMELGLMAGVIDQQGMLTPPRHLIPPLLYPGVRVSPFISLICISYLYFETDHSLVSYPFHKGFSIRKEVTVCLLIDAMRVDKYLALCLNEIHFYK